MRSHMTNGNTKCIIYTKAFGNFSRSQLAQFAGQEVNCYCGILCTVSLNLIIQHSVAVLVRKFIKSLLD